MCYPLHLHVLTVTLVLSLLVPLKLNYEIAIHNSQVISRSTNWKAWQGSAFHDKWKQTRAWETSEQHEFILVNAVIYFRYRALRSPEVTVQAPVVLRYLPVQTAVTLIYILLQISVTVTYCPRFFSLPPGMLAFHLNCTIFFHFTFTTT